MTKSQPREEPDLEKVRKTRYTIRQKDQEQEIEEDIQRELARSRQIRNQQAREKKERPIVYHEARYIQQPRYVEEQNIGVYPRTATYDAINRGDSKYQQDTYIDRAYLHRV